MGAEKLIAHFSAPDPDPLSPETQEILQILASEGPFLAAMEDIMARYQFEFEARVARLSKAENLLLAVILATLILEAIFIFRPTTRIIRESFNRLEKQENELRHINRELDAALKDAERPRRPKASSWQP